MNQSMLEKLKLLLNDDEFPKANEQDKFASSKDTSPKPASCSSSKSTETGEVNMPTAKNLVGHISDLALNEKKLKSGDLANLSIPFCPIMAISKYPYRFVSKHESENVAQAFFTEGKFWERLWDIYYVWPQDISTSKPILLTPANQVEALISDINKELCLNLVLGQSAESHGLVFTLPDHPDLRPRWLGQSNCKTEFNSLERNIPEEEWRPRDEKRATALPDLMVRHDWQIKLTAAFELIKGEKISKAAKLEKRLVTQHQSKADLKYIERCFGLRPPPFTLEKPSGLTWDEDCAWEAARVTARTHHPINPTCPPPYLFYENPILISIDVESWERNSNNITEVGVATLDTQNLLNIAPSTHAIDWQPLIHARHFRIRENMHLNNVDFVNGCADRFEFGTSEIISLADAPAILATCFRPPYRRSDIGTSQASSRKLILVGHDVTHDTRYLRKLGYDVGNLADLALADTSLLYRALTKEMQPKSLAKLLAEFNMTAWHLHNGGNDAVYTLWVLMAMVVGKASGEKIGEKTKEEKGKQERTFAEGMDEENGGVEL